MQCRITITAEGQRRGIRVDGWLSQGETAEILRLIEHDGPPAALVLDDLRGADDAGLSLLSRLALSGIPLRGVSPFVRLLLDGWMSGAG